MYLKYNLNVHLYYLFYNNVCWYCCCSCCCFCWYYSIYYCYNFYKFSYKIVVDLLLSLLLLLLFFLLLLLFCGSDGRVLLSIFISCRFITLSNVVVSVTVVRTKIQKRPKRSNTKKKSPKIQQQLQKHRKKELIELSTRKIYLV